MNWQDLHLFALVAEAGGLTAAAPRAGLSPPTLGRRMLALEQSCGRRLFDRAQTGYRLTRDGQDLLTRMRAMQAAAQAVQAFLNAQTDR